MIYSNMSVTCAARWMTTKLKRPEEKVMTKFEMKHHIKFTLHSLPLLLCPPDQA